MIGPPLRLARLPQGFAYDRGSLRLEMVILANASSSTNPAASAVSVSQLAEFRRNWSDVLTVSSSGTEKLRDLITSACWSDPPRSTVWLLVNVVLPITDPASRSADTLLNVNRTRL